MFEKEAEEYARQSCFTEMSNPSLSESIDISDDIKEAIMFGYNKANEWHYVKDGKYPKEKQLVMVYRVNPLGANIAITNWYDSYKDTKVIAWKEIVLPELKESE